MEVGNLRKRCRCGEGNSPRHVRHGSFYRTSDSRLLRRWKCLTCQKTFSQATAHPCYRQKKRKVNYPLYKLLCSGVSLRRSAKILNLNRITVVRKFHFLAAQAQLRQKSFLRRFEVDKLGEVIFDEMETFEHTKMKPVSIPLATTQSRVILVTEVAPMPAKGLLAAKARKKYGYRRDERPLALKRLFDALKPITQREALFKSDQNPTYPFHLFRAFPEARHETTKGGRSCVVGQGELKKLKWDPIFSLNHTAAMLRANLNRLFRKTWCTTKTLKGLRAHLDLYTDYHNQVLLSA